jgi:molybdopterin/thiamine biosynthesis adenylyltransferase
MPSDFRRYARQMRVAEVGRERQENLQHASVVVLGDDLSAHVEALYLAGAGVGTVRVNEVLAADVAALNSDIVIETDSEKSAPESDARASGLDAAAAQIFSGSARALQKMRAIFR